MMNFALYYAGDAYSTATKIMGRQSAGRALMKGVARTWSGTVVRGLGPAAQGGRALLAQLQADGYAGQVRWSRLPDLQTAREVGAVYFPSPGPQELAHLRNRVHPAAFSIMAATFTLSSAGAMDDVAGWVLPPYRPWDALICISECAKTMATQLHEEMRTWWTDEAGPMRFNAPQLPVIPLGVDVPFFVPGPENKLLARQTLGVAQGESVFLFAGRLSFHAKANPAPLYQALEQAAQQTPVVCIEAGMFPNESIAQAFAAAQKALAPTVRFIHVNGQDEARYRRAWQAADVFVSLAENIQETFGLTPVEAMAAGLPVIVADWNGYRETIRDGVDGFRVPTVLPPAGAGVDLALRHAMEADSYDMFIGRTSMATVVQPHALAQAVCRLATDAALRQTMGAAGQQRAQQAFDWPVVLRQYAALATELGEIRLHAAQQKQQPRSWPQRADPFVRFAHFSSDTMHGNWPVQARPQAVGRLQALLGLSMVNYAFDPQLLPRESLAALLAVLQSGKPHTVNSALKAAGQTSQAGMRALMWLWKLDLVSVKTIPGVRMPVLPPVP